MKLSNIFSIIPKRRVKQIPLIVFAMMIGALFEVLGIGLVIPLLSIISDTETAATKFLEQLLPGLSRQNSILLTIATFAAVYLIKGLYLSILAWWTGRFVYATKAEINHALMTGYLFAPYEFHLRQNSAQLLRNISAETSIFTVHAFIPVLAITTEFIVILAVSIFLLFVEPIGTITVLLLLALFLFFFHSVFGVYTKKIGKVREKSEGMFYQTVQEAFGGIKDVKVLGKEQYFLEQFLIHNRALSGVNSKQYTLNNLPRMYLETMSILVFLALLILLMFTVDDFNQVLPVLGVFALAAFRLLPSANRILTGMNVLGYAQEAIALLNDQLTAIDAFDRFQPSVNTNTARTLSSFGSGIEIKNLCYKYPDTDEFALSDINLTLKKGDSIGIIGRSGAGKSTLSDAILGLIKPSAGSIYIDGVDIHSDINSWHNLIGYVQQDIYLLDDSIRRNIAFGVPDDKIDLKSLNQAIFESQLDELVSSLPEGIDTQLGERGVRLSGGQKQRIGIARALYRNTPILVFDEATSALDNETESEIVSAIKSFKGIRTTIVIAHRLSTIEHCDRVIELKEGCITNIDELK
ncbi:MAG: ABC transporter ATP-binding protein [Methylophilaceae bacterium]|nr:ABC transporter ATP-binding protein [Methylophilaceae bacterium]